MDELTNQTKAASTVPCKLEGDNPLLSFTIFTTEPLDEDPPFQLNYYPEMEQLGSLLLWQVKPLKIFSPFGFFHSTCESPFFSSSVSAIPIFNVDETLFPVLECHISMCPHITKWHTAGKNIKSSTTHHKGKFWEYLVMTLL